MAWLTSTASAPSPVSLSISPCWVLGDAACVWQVLLGVKKGGRGRKLGKWKVTMAEGEGGGRRP